MNELATYSKVVKDYADVADFIFMYIAEAHPLDGLTVPNNKKQIKTHQRIGDRLVAAQILEEENLPCPVYVDTMTNAANMMYGAHPERLYIIENDTISYAGKLGPWAYDVGEVEEWLSSYRQRAGKQD